MAPLVALLLLVITFRLLYDHVVSFGLVTLIGGGVFWITGLVSGVVAIATMQRYGRDRVQPSYHWVMHDGGDASARILYCRGVHVWTGVTRRWNENDDLNDECRSPTIGAMGRAYRGRLEVLSGGLFRPRVRHH